MKQGTYFTKIIFVIVLVALVAYAVFTLLSSLRTSVTTTTALSYEAGEGFSTTGFVVRDEVPIYANSEINVINRSEGEKVSKGSVIATTYADSGAQELQEQITQLEEQITQLQYVYDASDTQMDTQAQDDEILSQLVQCAVYTTRGSLTALDSAATTLKSQILRRYLDADQTAALGTQISALESQLSQLKSQVAVGTSSVVAETSGYFSGTVDGYESLLTSEVLDKMTVADYESLRSQNITPPASAIGKLVTSSTWYYVTVADSEQVAGYDTGDELSVTFAFDFYEDLQMRVWRLSDEVDGKRLLVLSCNDYLWDITNLRTQSADLIAHSHSGLRVPKQAIYYDEESGGAGVYVLEGTNAVWKNVEILFELDESYIVKEDKSSINNLWPGDEIIVTTQELFDGKVVS